MPEPLFQPSLIGFSAYGLHDVIYQVHRKVPVDLCPELRDIVLSGGNSMWIGLQERVTKELSNLFGPTNPYKVSAPAERKYATWVGTALLASCTDFPNISISKDEYDEHGPRIVHIKCL